MTCERSAQYSVRNISVGRFVLVREDKTSVYTHEITYELWPGLQPQARGPHCVDSDSWLSLMGF